MDCWVYSPVAAGDLWGRVGMIGGGFSHESEHDLALMVSDFLENGSVGGAESWGSSDSDSGFSDFAHLTDKILLNKHSVAQFESDLQSVVHSLLLSINNTDIHLAKSGPCYASCIRFSLVKLLRLSGYDAAVCTSKWQGIGKVPGGDHEYIDAVNYNITGSSDRLIIDIDFRSHFEIARAVQSYARLLNTLPVVYVGSLTRLKQVLQVMADAARSSLKQNSMPLPPWRSLSYLQSKWQSPYQRQFNPDEQTITRANSSDHKQCDQMLMRLQSSLQSEMDTEHLSKSISIEKNRMLKLERRRHSFRTRR